MELLRETASEWLLWSCGLEWRRTGSFCLVTTCLLSPRKPLHPCVSSQNFAELCGPKVCTPYFLWSILKEALWGWAALWRGQWPRLTDGLVNGDIYRWSQTLTNEQERQAVPTVVPKFVTHRNHRTQWNNCCKAICFATRPATFISTAKGKTPSLCFVTGSSVPSSKSFAHIIISKQGLTVSCPDLHRVSCFLIERYSNQVHLLSLVSVSFSAVIHPFSLKTRRHHLS